MNTIDNIKVLYGFVAVQYLLLVQLHKCIHDPPVNKYFEPVTRYESIFLTAVIPIYFIKSISEGMDVEILSLVAAALWCIGLCLLGSYYRKRNQGARA